MLSSSSSKDDFNVIFSIDTDVHISYLSHDVVVLLHARLERRGVRWQVHGGPLGRCVRHERQSQLALVKSSIRYIVLQMDERDLHRKGCFLPLVTAS